MMIRVLQASLDATKEDDKERKKFLDQLILLKMRYFFREPDQHDMARVRRNTEDYSDTAEKRPAGLSLDRVGLQTTQTSSFQSSAAAKESHTVITPNLYYDLSGRRDIRILELLPGAEGTEIHCTLSVERLGSDLVFEVISFTLY